MTTAVQNSTPSQNPLPQTVLSANDWREAVRELILNLTNEGKCYSSGEIAALLREHYSSLAFSVTNMGEYIRDLFYSGGVPMYDDGFGGSFPPCQVSRTTAGLGRTPAGQMVFVYGPDQQSCMTHHFEVDIPAPPGSGARASISASNPPPNPIGGSAHASFPSTQTVQLTNQSQGIHPPHPTQAPTRKPVKISGQGPTKDEAKVHVDCRLCISRGVFEQYVQASGKLMRGGNPVFIEFDNDKLIVTMDQTANAKRYDLSLTRGRILVTHPTTPFTPGERFAITVSQDSIEVDLSNAL